MFSPAGVAGLVSTIAGELEAVVPGVAGLVGASPALVSEIEAGIDGLKTTAAALASADTSAAAGSLMDRVETDANAVLAALAALPLPPAIAIPMRIVQVMVPTLEGIAAIIWPPAPPAAATAAATHAGA
jgi:hypothetical protein